MEPLKLKASLKAVKSRKDDKEDILQEIVLHVWGTASQMGILNALYKQPLEITVEIVQ
jgi:hypothetical protein